VSPRPAVTERTSRPRGPALLIATLCGAGYSPVVPGTAGTLASIPLVFFAGRFLPIGGFAVAALLVTLAAIPVAGAAARRLGQKDPRPVVIDETAGLFTTLVGLPVDAARLAAAFVLFRIFDVLKPPPARASERLPGGLGIVADDVVAGLYANLAIRAAAFLYHRLA
jgi:phosphatidylglycerophosphatase A